MLLMSHAGLSVWDFEGFSDQFLKKALHIVYTLPIWIALMLPDFLVSPGSSFLRVFGGNDLKLLSYEAEVLRYPELCLTENHKIR